VNGWFRLAAASLLVFALATGQAAASSGNAGSGGGSISGETSSPATPASTTSTTSTTASTNTANVLIPTSAADSTTLSTSTSSSTPSGSTSTSSGSTSALHLTSHAFGSRLLSVGSRGTDVVDLQHDLTALGFTVSASGKFSHPTLISLRAFQRKYHLTVDGVAGPTSISTLKRLLNSNLHITEAPETSGTALTASTTASTPEPLSAADSGGVGFVPAAPTTGDGSVVDATLIDGLAIPAPGTPEVVQQVIDAANQIAFDPYIYGGGHASFTAAGYDCSGSVSFALNGGGLLATPLDSEQFAQYGESGVGNWITIYTNGTSNQGVMGHAYMEVAGLWFDTAAQSAANGMDRWSTTRISEPPAYGKFMPRHPAGW